jgi:hypothetical protein
MFAPKQYRTQAHEHSELIKGTDKPDEIREFRELERSFTELADNGEWMANNPHKTVHRENAPSTLTLTEEEGHILRYLGASVIMQWNTLPTKLQRELFDNASSVGEPLETGAFKQQVARFLMTRLA